ncbi:MAG: flagellar biosynthetic protein FliO [Pseudomonadota bacterium]
MDLAIYLRFAIALALVIGLITGAAWLVRRLGIGGAAPPLRGQRRLSLLETLPLDTKRRLVLIRRDDKDHLILLGPAGDILVEAPPVASVDGDD